MPRTWSQRELYHDTIKHQTEYLADYGAIYQRLLPCCRDLIFAIGDLMSISLYERWKLFESEKRTFFYILSTKGRTNCIEAVDKGQVIALESLSNILQAYTTFQALASIINVQLSIKLHAIAFG